MGRSGATAGHSWPASAAQLLRSGESWRLCGAGLGEAGSWQLLLRQLEAAAAVSRRPVYSETAVCTPTPAAARQPAARLYMFILDPSSPVAGGSLVPEFYSRGGILDTELGRLKNSE